MAAGRELNPGVLGNAFFLPLLLSPLVAVALTIACYQLLRRVPAQFGLNQASCICVGETAASPPVRVMVDGSAALLQPRAALTLAVGSPSDCAVRYPGRFWGVSQQRLLTSAHFISGGVVSFARGLNDTPKIVALMLVIQALDVTWACSRWRWPWPQAVC